MGGAILLGFLLIGCGDFSRHSGTFVRESDLCDGYTVSQDSPYILPYRVGESYSVGQGNCGASTHRGLMRFAYDFDMPIGTLLVAVRSGTVIDQDMSNSDKTREGYGANILHIQHDDGTVAMYVHLTPSGSLVSNGERVIQGQVIAVSGSSGTDGAPHLHLMVRKSKDDYATLPMTFRNTEENNSGLRAFTRYRANE